MAFRRAGASRAKKIDFKQWDALPSISLALDTATTIIGGSFAFSIPATILRIRGMLLVTLDNAAEGDDTFLTAALGMVSSDAAALGATAMPDPGSEPEYPWLWWASIPLFATQSITGVDPSFSTVSGAARLEVDSKAMRKVKPGESLIWVFQGTDTVLKDLDVGQTRVLIGS